MTTPIDPPTAADLEAMRSLPRDVVGRAVAGHHEAAARAERARELAELDPRLDRWAELEAEAAAVAGLWLAGVIRAAVPNPGDRATRGIRHEGTLYLATPAAGDSGGWVLLVVDDSAVLDSAHGLAFEPAPGVFAGRPAWLERAMAAAEELGEVEARRRAFGPAAGRGESWPDWRELVRLQLEDLGRAEATRRMRGPSGGLPVEGCTPAGWKPPAPPEPPAPVPPGWDLVEWTMLVRSARELGFDEAFRRLATPPEPSASTPAGMAAAQWDTVRDIIGSIGYDRSMQLLCAPLVWRGERPG